MLNEFSGQMRLHEYLCKHCLIQIPDGILVAAGTTIKIQTVEYFTYNGYNGWAEIEFYGVEDPELINQLVWKDGEDIDG